MEVTYGILSEPEISLELFQHFKRYQKVTRCWRKEADGWKLKEIPFVEEWKDAEYEFLVKCLYPFLREIRNNSTIKSGPVTRFASRNPIRLL